MPIDFRMDEVNLQTGVRTVGVDPAMEGGERYVVMHLSSWRGGRSFANAAEIAAEHVRRGTERQPYNDFVVDFREMERQVSSLAGGLLDMATTVEEIRRVTATGNLDGILDSSENALE